MLVKIICIISNYYLISFLNYKWIVDGLHIKKVPASKVFTPILYYIIRPYNSGPYNRGRKTKNKDKVYEFGSLLVEVVSHLFFVTTIIDELLLDGLLWSMQGWLRFIYILCVPIVGVIYIIANEIIKLINKKDDFFRRN